jgi:hypothetical protein
MPDKTNTRNPLGLLRLNRRAKREDNGAKRKSDKRFLHRFLLAPDTRHSPLLIGSPDPPVPAHAAEPFDFGFWILDCRFWTLDGSTSLTTGFNFRFALLLTLHSLRWIIE